MDDTPSTGVNIDALIGEQVVGRFLIERRIGQGHLSSAFIASDERLRRRVTVKIFHPQHKDDTQVVATQVSAARKVARLSHEHIALVIDQGEHNGMSVIVFEYIRGENLQERIDRYAPLDAGEVSKLGLQIARAMTYAHGQGVVHGNLRPVNILLTEDKDVKIVDFGGGSYVTQLIGDPYLAPELRQVDVDAANEPEDDIYALGAILFTTLTDQPAADDVSANEVRLLRPDIPVEFAQLIAKCLATDPRRRPISMREVAAELSLIEKRISPAASNRGNSAFGRVIATEDTHPFDVANNEDADSDTERAIIHPQIRKTKRTRKKATPRERRARWLAWSMVVVPLLGLALVGVMLSGEQAEAPKVKKDTRASGPVKELKIASAVSFDPEGDGEEHPESVANVIDGDKETLWQTDGYDTDDFSKLKPGVGVVLQLEEPTDVRNVVFITELPSWRVQIFAAASPQPKLADWTAVSDKVPVKSGENIPVNMRDLQLDGMPPGRAQALLVWISYLSLDVEDPAHSRARFSEVKVYGATDG